MLRGTPEGTSRLIKGERAGRGSFLRLAATAVGAGIGLEALTQIAPAQTTEAAPNEQQNRRAATSTQSVLQPETPLTSTKPKKWQDWNPQDGSCPPSPSNPYLCDPVWEAGQIALTALEGILGTGAIVGIGYLSIKAIKGDIKKPFSFDRERRRPEEILRAQEAKEKEEAARRDAENRRRAEEWQRQLEIAERHNAVYPQSERHYQASAFPALLREMQSLVGYPKLYVGRSVHTVHEKFEFKESFDPYSVDFGSHYAILSKENSKVVGRGLGWVSTTKSISWIYVLTRPNGITVVKGGVGFFSDGSSIFSLEQSKNPQAVEKALEKAWNHPMRDETTITVKVPVGF